MKVLGEGSTKRLEKDKNGKLKQPKDCRKWMPKVSTDCGVKEKRFNGTYTQAKKALQEFKTALTLDIKSIKFSDYAATWYNRRERGGQIAPSTLTKDRNTLRILCKHFGNMKISDITRGVAIDGLLDIKEANEYSNTFHCEMHIKLKSILTSAVKDGYLESNPIQDEPAPKRDKPNRTALSPDDVLLFLERLSYEPLSARVVAVYIAVLSGARRGEICGFTWNDVDLDKKLMHVRRSIMENGQPKDPKTSAGFRTYPIVSTLVDVLRRWQSIQERQLMQLNIKQTVDTPVITSDVGGILHPLNFDRWWRQNRDRFSLSGVVIHELRHTYMTLLANSGAPSKVIQSIAGWSSIKMADVYVHEDVVAQAAAVSHLEKTLGLQGDN